MSYPQLRAEALELLRSKFPEQKFEVGSAPDVIRMGDAELGLQNLRSKLCASSSLSKPQRHDELVEYFERMVSSIKNSQSNLSMPWALARDKVRVQFMHADYLRPFEGKRVLVTRPFIPDVHIAVVVDQPTGYVYVREEDRVRWRIGEKVLFETALKNVDVNYKSARLQGGGKPDPFLASEEKDGYDAIRLLLPWVRSEASKHLGNPFFASISNRDFLIMWGIDNSAYFQERARQNIALDYGSQPYKLSPLVLKVWADGRVEVAK
ncbi:hypothetical protein [Azonexus fungiphilus]|uniref:hypothetical protein n=1 Tax=Azonexus fungiphilus TaxID=146940 RepID=UPI000EB47AC5|nr:hypothetical protein [Azonexus fungiphilus]